MADNGELEIDKLRKELVNLAEITNNCQRSYENVLGALKKGEILPLAAQPLLKQHMETVCNMSVIRMVETRLKSIKRREIAVLVAGEFNAGKSTFVNILMGGPYLPMDRGKVTHVVCEIRHYSLHMAILKFDDKGDDELMILKEDRADMTWNELRECIRTKAYKSKITGIVRQLERIIIYWPLKVMEGILDANIDIQDENVTTTRQKGNDNMIPRERDRNMELPPEFVSRLRRPYARSFSADEHTGTPDPDQTSRKKVVTSNEHTRVVKQRPSPNDQTVPNLPKSQPIDIRRTEEVKAEINTPIGASVEFASDAVPASQPNQPRSILYDRKNQINENIMSDDDDQSETEVADIHQTFPKQISEHEAESSQIKQDEIAEETPVSNSEEQNVNQVPFQFVFLDCPGIDLQDDEKDSPEYTGLVEEVERCQAFIFIIDTNRDTGVKKRGIKALMEDIEINFTNRNMNMNPDQSVFVANKADEVLEDTERSRKLQQEVAEKLAETWPLVRKEHVVPFQANKELEGHLQSTGKLHFLQWFLLKTMRLTLEEHCIWLLRMLEIAHAMAKLGQQSSPVVHKLTKELETVKQDALALQEESNEISDDGICRKAWEDLKAVLLRHDADFQNIHWDIKELKKRVPKEDIDLQELSKCVYLLIGEKIEEQIRSSATKLREVHTKEFNKIYKKFEEKIEKLQSSISGLEEIKRVEGSLKSGIFSLLAPAAISVSVRAAPILYPFVFLAAPILPIGLFGQLVIEDIRESRNESRISEFKAHMVEFMEKETDRILKIAKKDLKKKGDLPESPLFTYFFGESRKKILHDKTEKVLKVVEILQEMTYDRSESNQKCCKIYIIEMLKLYVEKVMKHEFTEKNDIRWVLNEEGIRRTIEEGNNACTYEATISDRFEFKELVAVKEFRCKLEPSDVSKSLPTEVDAYRECFHLRQLSRKHHCKLVNFLGTGTSVTDGYLNLRIVMERYSGNLKRHVIATPRSPSNKKHREEFLHYAKECTEGLKFLHDNNVIHRDVKPSNYLIKKGTEAQAGDMAFYSVVISDVGCAKAEEAICTLGQEKGTRVYWAPEISLANTFHSKPSDVFSLGLVLWEIWVRKPSYDENGRKRELLKVVEKEGMPMVKGCLNEDPRKRETAAGLLKELNAIDS